MYPTSQATSVTLPLGSGSTFSTIPYGAGNVPYVGPPESNDHPTVARFGDYSGISADGAPCSDSFWGATMNGGFGMSGAWATSIGQFTLAAPTLTSITPSSGPFATKVDVYGTFFTSNALVTFGASPSASMTFIDSTHLQVSAPAHPPGTVDVTVATPKGMAPIVPADRFTFPPAAYVANSGSNNVSYVDMSSLGPLPIGVGTSPQAVRVTNDATAAYTANQGSGDATPIDTFLQLSGAPYPVGTGPTDLVVTPDGRTLYVADGGSSDVRVVNALTGQTKATIPFGAAPTKEAITPDGATVLVTFSGADDILAIDTATKTVLPFVYDVTKPFAIAVAPNGLTAWVTDIQQGSCAIGLLGSLTPIDLVNHTVGNPIVMGCSPRGVAVSPDGSTVWVSNADDGTVQPVDASSHVPGSAIPLLPNSRPFGLVVTPDGATLLVADRGRGQLAMVDTTSTTVLPPINVGSQPVAVDVTHPIPDPCAGQLVKARLGFLQATVPGSSTVDELLNVQYCPPVGLGPLPVNIKTAVTVPMGCPPVAVAGVKATLQPGDNVRSAVLTAPACPGTYRFKVKVNDGTTKYLAAATLKVT